ncbi:hypothetical protein [Olleya sp. YS]|uniref:tetratricopeptide repeat protein n=1 Tax=Olleya sp. YS TaxID=3028318 RepID=UPI0024345E6C|nr:hypothetical protein [Olleya sp. YS]WGD34074.1 hypothetical protein Ollyesu_09800 [Olleya sp. YS]
MKHQIIKFFLIINIGIGFTQNETDSIKSNNLKSLKNELKTYKDNTNKLNTRIAVLEESISNLEKNNESQREFYKDSQTTIIQIISAAFALMLAAFAAFAFLYNKPHHIWKKYKKTRDEAKSILKRLEFQYRHQESIFMIGKKALFQYTKRDWDMIEQYSNNALTTKPSKRTPNDWAYIGLYKFKSGDVESSIIALEKATELDKNFEVALKHLGTIYDINKQHLKAIEAFDRIIYINPLNDQAYNNAGISSGQLNHHQKAVEYYKKGIKANPENCFIYTNLFEENIVNDESFDKKLVKIFKNKFSENKDAMSVFEMYGIYNKILIDKDLNLELALDNWKNDYGIVFPVESFHGIENWILNKPNSEIKNKLNKALIFFKNLKPNNMYN